MNLFMWYVLHVPFLSQNLSCTMSFHTVERLCGIFVFVPILKKLFRTNLATICSFYKKCYWNTIYICIMCWKEHNYAFFPIFIIFGNFQVMQKKKNGYATGMNKWKYNKVWCRLQILKDVLLKIRKVKMQQQWGVV